MKPIQLTDDMRLVGAAYHGHPLRIYDDGFGRLWVIWDSMSILGVVRANSWEAAFGIAEDEFFPEATETVDELRAEYGFDRRHVKIVLGPEGEREARPEDYVNGSLSLPFVRWETVETPNPDAWSENELFCEAYGFRPNGPNGRDKLGHGIYAKDLNGEAIDRLTDALAEQLGITLEFAEW